jgi:serine/threonine protein kinase
MGGSDTSLCVQGMHDFSMADVLREVEVLYTVGGHPGVVGLHEVYEDDEEASVGCDPAEGMQLDAAVRVCPAQLHLIMELCTGGDWFERLINFGRCVQVPHSTRCAA